MSNMLTLIGYFAVGLLVHILSYGPENWGEGWTYVVMILWPLFLMFWFFKWMVICILILLMGWGAWSLYKAARR